MKLSFEICVLSFAAAATAVYGQSAAGESTIEQLKLLSIDELMDLRVTSVSRRPERLSETASAIQVITGDDIRRSGATNLPESLRLATNLQVAQKGAHSWGISARGFNTDLANKLLVLVDGRTVYTPLYSGVFWDRQDYLLADIDRIEVISGPGGSLWGANAVNGVINVTTKSAKDTHGVYLEGGGGLGLDGFAAARYGGTLAPGIDFRIYGKYSNRNDESLSTGVSASDGWSMAQFGFRIDAAATSADNITLQGDDYSSDERVATGGHTKTAGGNVLGRWSRTLSGDSRMSLQAYADRTHMVTAIPALVLGGTTFAPAGNLRDNLDTYDIDFQHELKLGTSHQIVWGLGYRATRDDVINAPALAFLPPKLNQDLFSAFGQDKVTLKDNLWLTFGSKVEHTAYTDWEVEPGLRLQLDLADKGMVWAAASHAVRAPSRIDRDLSQAAPPALVVLKGSPAFDSETVNAYELGWRGRLASKITVSLATFYNVYDNLRSTSITPTTVVPFFFANNLEADTYGLEFSGAYPVNDSWQLSAGYNLLKEHVRVKAGQFDLNSALNETSDPKQQFSIRSSARLPARIELTTGLRWVDTLQTHNGSTPATTPSYFSLDVNLGWHPTESLEFSLVGQNLLEKLHPEYGAPGPAREEINRKLFAKVVWRN